MRDNLERVLSHVGKLPPKLMLPAETRLVVRDIHGTSRFQYSWTSVSLDWS